MSKKRRLKYLQNTKKLKNLERVISNHLSVDVKSKSRKREFVDARFMFSFISVSMLNISLNQTAKFLNKNHSTVIYYKENFNGLILSDKDFKESYSKLLMNNSISI